MNAPLPLRRGHWIETIEVHDRMCETTMDNEQFCKALVDHGYAVLKSSIPTSLIEQCKGAVIYRLGQLLKEKNVDPTEDIFLDFLEAIKHYRQFEVLVDLSKYLQYTELRKDLLLQPQVLDKLIAALGPDLQYETGAEMTANVIGVQDGYLVKKFHQEFWSGTGVNTLQTWTPIAIKQGMGGLEIIEESHHWGHIPHRNREPIEIPSDAQHTILNLQEGDTVIFHSLLLHATVPNQHPHPRIAVPQPVRSLNARDTGFEDLKNWETFHYSPMSQIRKRLGNPHLSPFRTYGSQRTQFFR